MAPAYSDSSRQNTTHSGISQGSGTVQFLLRPIKFPTIQDSFCYRSNTAPILFWDLPMKTMFLDNTFFNTQWVKRTGIGGENDRGLFKAWNWGSSGKALLNQKVAHREGPWAGQRYGHSCTKHGAAASSWASRSGRECSPAGRILWYLLFFSFTPGAPGRLLPSSPPEKVSWIGPNAENYSLACRGLSGTPNFLQLKPGETLGFISIFAWQCSLFFQCVPFTVLWLRVQIQAFLTHTVLKWLSNLCVSLSFFLVAFTPLLKQNLDKP